MNTSAKLLDCTLRDGAYVVDKEFGDIAINGIIKGLTKSGIDIIEIGFFQDEGFGKGKTVFRNSKDAKRFIPSDKNNAMYCVLADYSRYSVSNLDFHRDDSVDAVRACFFKHERYKAMEMFREIKNKGYKLFIQPVDALGYTDTELIELINIINELEPYCFSIVDTFGSMYSEDLHRIYSIVDYNLVSNSFIGFHSHNNLQMSNSLAQEFLRISSGHRNVIVDATINGMGRGAGNTPTELIAQYMVSKLGYTYDMDSILDLVDNYIEPIKAHATWGYNIQMYLAGNYSAHVNNIDYLKKKNSIRSKDIRFILNKISPSIRKRYDYDLLEKTYMESVETDIDDSKSLAELKDIFENQNIVIIAPGKTSLSEGDKIIDYIKCNDAKVISINFVPENVVPDFVYISNVHRYELLNMEGNFKGVKKIITSNVIHNQMDKCYIVSLRRLLKCGWQYADNSAILLLRLLNILNVKKIGIAGLDGYELTNESFSLYADKKMELPISKESAILINKEIKEMLLDIKATKRNDLKIEFITTSRFA